jgi:aspartate dehydrogenase
MKRFAVIGFGAITEEMVRCLAESGEMQRLAGVLVRPARLAEFEGKAGGRFPVVESIEALLGLQPEIVAECAGHGAMRQYAATILSHQTDLLCSSVGVLADRALCEELSNLGKAKIWIPSGAVAGIDGLLAARTAGLRQVTYTSAKPPVAWNGTPAEKKLIGPTREQRTVFFEGSAREAAMLYPKNVNVGATVSFAGIGLDRTQVKLVSDPELSGPLGIIEAEGDFGRFRFDILAYASPRNPKTSLLTAHSMLAAVREGICFAIRP